MAAARWVMCAAGALLVSGCLAPAPDSPREAGAQSGSRSFFSGATARKPPLAKISLAGGDVVVSGPRGYCIDPESRSAGPERGFAVIASCHILSGGKAGEEVPPMLVTVTVGPRVDRQDLPTAGALAAAAGAELIGAKQTETRVTAHLATGGEGAFDGSDARYWRAAFLQGDRLVGLALYAPKGSALAGERGAAMLDRVSDTIARQSPGAKPTASGTPAPKGFLGRLFNP